MSKHVVFAEDGSFFVGREHFPKRGVGFNVDPKAWCLEPNTKYDDNPPDDWEECDCCNCYHPPAYSGDCRSDINRWPSEACVRALTGA